MNWPRFIRRLFRAPYDGLRHYAAVEEGALYRCGQPQPDQLAELIARHALRTVIAVRGSRSSEDPDAWEVEERAVCEAHGVAFVSLPCNHKNPPTEDQVARFLEIMRTEERRPALLHCRIGQQRTGLFCALYRVHVQGVDREAALEEMDALGFNIRHRRHQRLLRAFYAFTEPGALRGVGAGGEGS